MTIHDNVKAHAIDFIRGLLDDKHFVEPEFYVGPKRIDVAFRNLRFIGEVEPDEYKKINEGIPQLETYAEHILKTTGYKEIYGAIFWATDRIGSAWEVETYEFKLEKNEVRKIFLGKGKDKLKDVIANVSQDKLPLTTSNFLLLFTPLKNLFLKRIQKLYDNYKNNDRIRPLILAYKNALTIIYGKKVVEHKIKQLFAIHTLIQLIANGILSFTLDGQISSKEDLTGRYKKYSVALPFLEWLYILYEAGEIDGEILEELLREIRRRILALDWQQKTKDIFRLLYEEFIAPEDRRSFGEYYTPLWLVKFMADNIGKFNNKIILDPFCGSGTFLDESFRRKLKEGASPSAAIREIIGFDINPIAVMLARAELLISYKTYAKDEKEYPTPLVFYINSAEFLEAHVATTRKLFAHTNAYEKPIFLYHIKELTEIIKPASFEYNRVVLQDIETFERALKLILEEAAKNPSDAHQKLREQIKMLTKSDEGQKIKYFFDAIDEQKLANLIKKYGDGVWAVSISSFFAIDLIIKNKIDIITSNPPWINLTEVHGEYGTLLKEHARKMLQNDDPIEAVVQAGNTASVFLGAFANASDKTFFVMPQSVVYDGSAHGAGKILTLRAVKDQPHKVFKIDFDVFGHGEKSSLILVGEGSGEIYEIHAKTSLNKEDESAELTITKVNEKFEESVKKVMDYFKENRLESDLQVSKIYKQGSYIRGLFGGEDKKGKTKYAGLVLGDYIKGYPPKIKLSNTNSYVDFLEKNYMKKILTYSSIKPFYATVVYAILSEKGEKDLKAFLAKIKNKTSLDDQQLIQKLIEELQQGRLTKLKREMWYSVYRGQRGFAAVTIQGDDETVLESHLSAIETPDQNIAYYYTGVLNYLLKKVGRGFIRNQFARPLLAIKKAGLPWREQDWQYKIAELAKSLHIHAEEKYQNLINKKAKHIKDYIGELSELQDWKLMEQILDQNIQDLDAAVSVVADLKKAN